MTNKDTFNASKAKYSHARHPESYDSGNNVKPYPMIKFIMEKQSSTLSKESKHDQEKMVFAASDTMF